MKIRFDPDLAYQRQAIEAVCSVFKGQRPGQTTFSIARETEQHYLPGLENDLGLGNRLELSSGELYENICAVQRKNGLPVSQPFNPEAGLHLSIEMETGTGKTYVYLRTVFELNKRHGFTKFIIVVPSVAIKEGVYKSLEMTASHFHALYENAPFDFFIYDSQRLSDVRNFATDSTIQIMVINIDAFRSSFKDPDKESKANIIHRFHDKMCGAKPIEYLRQTRPIVIIDEPQSVDKTDKGKEAVESLDPLCTVRYSATHIDKHHMLYKLDALDAYELQLVKQIEVAAIEVKNHHNQAYIKLVSVDNKKSPITARIEIDCQDKRRRVKRKTVTVKGGADIFEKSGARPLYAGYVVERIDCKEGEESITFINHPEPLRPGQSMGEKGSAGYKRLQIRKTIEEHLDKELRLKPLGIKVLSLFFIDKVANYRSYDREGKARKGEYARIFEEEYIRAGKKADYRELFQELDLRAEASVVHNGYFAIDKKKDAAGEARVKDSSGTALADESAYHLIMKDKEKLLGFESRLKFIFSHSTLREGWDSPNIFQICTLNETQSVLKKRQEIGRGLRLAVNQQGERVRGFEVNTLTIMANESYETFAAKLQQEIERETAIRFGRVEKHLFNDLTDKDGKYLVDKGSMTVWGYLFDNGHIDREGMVSDGLKKLLAQNDLDLPKRFKPYEPEIIARLKKVCGNLQLKNRDARKKIALQKEVFLSEAFQELWERVKYKTRFHIDFDTETFIEQCAARIKDDVKVDTGWWIYRKAEVDIDRGGIKARGVSETTTSLEKSAFPLPDLITYLESQTHLKRSTIVKILVNGRCLESFKNNPQTFLEKTAAVIKEQMRLLMIDGIKYRKIGDRHYYSQELFKNSECVGYIEKNMIESKKSVFDHVVYDSEVERRFVLLTLKGGMMLSSTQNSLTGLKSIRPSAAITPIGSC
ncbi:MAG: DEAD/DEAH box helicase family protein [Chlamydiota bacterium]